MIYCQPSQIDVASLASGPMCEKDANLHIYMSLDSSLSFVEIMSNPIGIKKLACDDAENYGALFGGWSHTITQLNSGRFGYTGWSIGLPGIQIYLDNHKRSIRWSEFSHIPVTALFIPVRSEGTIRWAGRELREHNAVIQGSNFEHHFATSASASFIYLDVNQDLLQRMNWHVPENRDIQLSKYHRMKLVDFCLGLPSARIQRDASRSVLFVRNQVLALLEKALFASGGELPSDQRRADLTDYNVFRAAELILEGKELSRPVAVDELVQTIGVSKRSLYRAFENQIGTSPSRYIEMLRLKALRRYLLSETGSHQTINDAAMVFGYSNPGRMARRYVDLFHEYPKETIARGKLKHG